MTTATLFGLPASIQQRDRLRLLAGYLLDLTTNQPTDKPASWLLPLRWEPLTVEPGGNSDAFIVHVFKFLSDHRGVTGRQGRALTFEKMALKSMAIFGANDERLLTKLGLVFYEGGIYAFAIGFDDLPNVRRRRIVD